MNSAAKELIPLMLEPEYSEVTIQIPSAKLASGMNKCLHAP